MNADVKKAVEALRSNSSVPTDDYVLIEKVLRNQEAEIAGNDAENAELIRALDMCRIRAEKAEALLRECLPYVPRDERFISSLRTRITAHLGGEQ